MKILTVHEVAIADQARLQEYPRRARRLGPDFALLAAAAPAAAAT